MKRFFFVWSATVALLFSHSGAKNSEWTTYSGDLGNSSNSPVDHVNANNFRTLQLAWRFQTYNKGPRPETNLEGTPLMAKGVLYATAGTRRAAVAIDAATGEVLWMHSENEGTRGAN